VVLIDTHYRGMLFAEKYLASPASYHPQNRRTIAENRPEFLDDRFTGDDDLFLRPNLPADEGWRSLLPDASGWVNVACVWFGGLAESLQCAEMTFCADTEMERLLRMKAATSGLNTDLLGGKNCHVWPCPDMPELLGGAAIAIATDRMVNY